MNSHRRDFLAASTTSLLMIPQWVSANEVPVDNPTAHLKLDWTQNLHWENVLDITTIKGTGKYWDKRLVQAQERLKNSGGVVYFPAGEYHFEDHIYLKSGIILRGANPMGSTKAHDEKYQPPARIEFPRYNPIFTGNGTPTDSAFKGIYLEAPAKAENCGVVNLSINRGHIHFKETEDHQCGGQRIVYGCVLRNAAVADPNIPSSNIMQHPWQRFTARHHAAVDVTGSANILIANNRLPKSGDDNFIMKDFRLKPARNSKDRYDVEFDYDNRPGLYIGHYCVGGPGGSGNDGTPDTHPWGFRKGIVIRDNYVFNTGRMCIGFGGEGTVCSNNITRIEKDVWRPTVTGAAATHGSSTNDNRAIEMRGWKWTVDGNDFVVHRNWCAEKDYAINDGEGLMHEDHCNSDIRESRLTNNKGNSYLSIYKCGVIDGLLVEGNDISVPSSIADIYIVANRNSGNQPCRNVSILNNTTRSNGILIAGSPASNNVVKGNVHKGKSQGYLKNEAKAEVSGNKNYA
jgi:hypothetical protein